MTLTLEKIFMTLKMMSWKFIVPCLVAFIICCVALGFMHGTIPIVITALTMIGINGLLVGLFLSGWLRYFKHIKHKTLGIYIIPNNVWKQNAKINLKKFKVVVQHACSLASDLCAVYRVYVPAQEIEASLKGTVVAFVDDISETAYNKKWGTKYKKIAGLCGGDCLLVEYNYTHMGSLISTALNHELNHLIMNYLSPKLDEAQRKIFKDKLGLEA